jgi:hypothetical protein
LNDELVPDPTLTTFASVVLRELRICAMAMPKSACPKVWRSRMGNLTRVNRPAFLS